MPPETELIHCTTCHKNFPINNWKHPNRTSIFCPFCHTEYENETDPNWHPNEAWHKSRHKSQPFTIAAMRRILQGLVRRR
jgi:hypothetical protein